MHLISFDASPRQVSKLRNGHKVRIKRGSGFNLVVSPNTYHLVNRAFTRNKGLDIQLSQEELQNNQNMSPEQHDELGQMNDNDLHTPLPFAEGGSIFKKAKKASKSKQGKAFRQALKPAGREFLKAGQDMAHQSLAEAHMNAASNVDNEHLRNALNSLASTGHESIHNIGRHQEGGALFKFLGNKKMKAVRRALKPAGRAFQNYAQDELHNQLGQLHMAGADYIPDNPNAQMGYNLLAQAGHNAIGYNQNPYGNMYGHGLGAGMGASVGYGMNVHHALKMANLATAHANHQLAKFHNATVHGQITQPAIKRYWNEALEPISRGTGIRGAMNFIRGRGALVSQDHLLPQALQSQPYGANFHMQFQLPPEYHRYNDGGELEGRGLYI